MAAVLEWVLESILLVTSLGLILVYLGVYVVLAAVCLRLGSGVERRRVSGRASSARTTLARFEGPHSLAFVQLTATLVAYVSGIAGHFGPVSGAAALSVGAASVIVFLVPIVCRRCRTHPYTAGALAVTALVLLEVPTGAILGAFALLVAMPYEVALLGRAGGATGPPSDCGDVPPLERSRYVSSAMLWTAVLTVPLVAYPATIVILLPAVLLYVGSESKWHRLSPADVDLLARAGAAWPCRWVVRRSLS